MRAGRSGFKIFNNFRKELSRKARLRWGNNKIEVNEIGDSVKYWM